MWEVVKEIVAWASVVGILAIFVFLYFEKPPMGNPYERY